jgi:hypothetical protein
MFRRIAVWDQVVSYDDVLRVLKEHIPNVHPEKILLEVHDSKIELWVDIVSRPRKTVAARIEKFEDISGEYCVATVPGIPGVITQYDPHRHSTGEQNRRILEAVSVVLDLSTSETSEYEVVRYHARREK